MLSFFIRHVGWVTCFLCVSTSSTAQMGGGFERGRYPTSPILLAPRGVQRTPPPPQTAILNDEEKRIFAELDKKKDWDLKPMAVGELATRLNERVPCRLETAALEEAGASSEHLLDSFQGDHVRTSWMLSKLLRPAGLSWVVRDGQLVITSDQDAENSPRLMVLPVIDLIEAGSVGVDKYDYDGLVNLITSTVSPNAWRAGQIHCWDSSGALVCQTEWRMGEEIERLLEALRRARRDGTDSTRPSARWYGLHVDCRDQWEGETAITVCVNDVSLNTLVQRLRDETQFPIRLDTQSLDEDWMEGNARVDFSANDEPFVVAVRRALRPQNLTIEYSYPSFVITPQETADLFPVIRIYPIHDLHRYWDDAVPARGKLKEELIEQLTANVMPASWDGVGGIGKVRGVPGLQALVVVQSLEGHDKTEDLLDRFRKLVIMNRSLRDDVDQLGRWSYVVVYPLADGKPVERVIQLLQELVPQADREHRSVGKQAYIEPFGQGIVVRSTWTVHACISSLLRSLRLLPVPDPMSAGDGGFEPSAEVK